jgi:hypothetical protein
MRTTTQLHVASLIFMSSTFVSCHEEIEKGDAQKDAIADGQTKNQCNADTKLFLKSFYHS